MKEMQLCGNPVFRVLHPSYRLRFDTTDGEKRGKVK